MKISIITVCYNSESTIEDTIQSVLSQKYDDLEYIVVDGQSTDNTLNIVKKYEDKIDKIISEPDQGIYDAINKGIANATGDIVGLLHSDDVYTHPHALKLISQQFQSQKVDSVYADLLYVDREDTENVKRYWKSSDYSHGKFLKGWMPAHPTFFAKRNLFAQFGNYNLALSQSADYELMLRFLHKFKISASYLPEVIVKMRIGGKSNVTLSNRLRANRQDREAWKINNLKPGLLTLVRKPLSKLTQFFSKPEAAAAKEEGRVIPLPKPSFSVARSIISMFF